MSHDAIFWCVWHESGGTPIVKHKTLKSAEDEAQRLARLHPARRFVVMQAVSGYVTNDLTKVYFGREWEDIP